MSRDNSRAMWYAVVAGLGLALVFLGLGLYLALTGEGASSSEGERTAAARKVSGPDMVLIVLDAMRADRVGAERKGVPVTPFLNKLREEGAWFPDAMTACTWTRPAMASLFTSAYVETHGIVFAAVDEAAGDRQTALGKERATLAGVLAEAGYATAGVQTNGNLFPVMGFDRGFQHYDTSLDAPGQWVTDTSLKALSGLSSPFFLYAHYMDTHVPYHSSDKWRQLLGYDGAALSEEERKIVEDFKDYYVEWCHYVKGRHEVFAFEELSEAGKEAALLLYDASVREVDEAVRILVEGVWAKSPEAVVVVLADHGEHFWDHGLLGHGLSVYDCELRIPLIIHGGKTPPGRQEGLAEIVDVAPTLVSLTGLDQPVEWQGKNLFSHVERPAYARTQSDSPAWNVELDTVVAGDLKLIVNGKDGTQQLFDRKADPEEEQDLSAERPEDLSALLSLLHRHRADNLRRRSGGHTEVTVDPETLEQLRQLGYMH